MRRTTTQGEALVTWALWALLCVAIVITYARLEPAELYHVSRDGLVGGLSRALVVSNFPISLVAIALVLVAMQTLRRRAWTVGAPAIALCAVIGLAGSRRPGRPRCAPGKRRAGARRRARPGADARRPPPGRLATVTRLYLALAFAYGAVNLVQDAWNEQLVKRDWVGWKIPSALEPRPEPVWLIVLALAAAAALALRRDEKSTCPTEVGHGVGHGGRTGRRTRGRT